MLDSIINYPSIYYLSSSYILRHHHQKTCMLLQIRSGQCLESKKYIIFSVCLIFDKKQKQKPLKKSIHMPESKYNYVSQLCFGSVANNVLCSREQKLIIILGGSVLVLLNVNNSYHKLTNNSMAYPFPMSQKVTLCNQQIKCHFRRVRDISFLFGSCLPSQMSDQLLN